MRTVNHNRYLDRELGDLSRRELAALSNIWLPRIAANWRTLGEDYYSDYMAISAAVEARSEQ